MHEIKFWLGKFRLIEVGFLLCLFATSPAKAQITPDATLPVNSSVINQGSTSLIGGGTANTSNLFHSFEQFSVSTGGTAYFNNALDIQNIFSRVTGGSISNIDGILRANGTANLFLLNPNGILFGPNAQLNIGGSFVSSTANSINFADNTQFSANTSQSTPLLTISVPIGLGFGSNPGEIRVQNIGHNLIGANSGLSPLIRGNSSTGLRVQPGKTIALVGGDISLDGGILRAEGGRIELSSVDSGVVSLNPTILGWNLGYEGTPFFRNIRLSQRALADASGLGSGSIQVQGRQVTLVDGSVMLIQNQGLFPGGALSMNASNSLKISGTDPIARVPGGLENETLGFGSGGDIFISTPSLVLETGALVSTRTFGTAGAGNIIVNAPKSLELIGASPRDPRVASNIISLTTGSGSSGNIEVSTGQFTATGGAFLASVTRGIGTGGNITVGASDSVELIGINPITFQPSAISAPTLAFGQAGRVTINTSRLVVKDGSRVDSSATIGSAGSVEINAFDSVEIIGVAPSSQNRSLITSSVSRLDETLLRTLGLSNALTGTSGDVKINTNRLSITNGGLVSVRNDGTGNAGTLQINANSIDLDNQSGITAATATSQGGEIGEIILRTQNLQLRRNSEITTKAEGGSARGGNITIDTDTLVALENSNIDADAAGGPGGRVEINTQGIFGIEPRSNPTSESDITATSGVGVNGELEINTLDFDARNTLTPLQSNFVSTEQVVEGSCLARRNRTQGSFIVTGNGGLPITPYSGIEEWEVLTGRQAASDESVQSERSPSALNPSVIASTNWKLGDPIIEAQGIVKTADGRTLLGSLPVATANAQALTCSAATSSES